MLADRVALMMEGRLLQFREPRLFYGTPSTPAVARFFRNENFLPGKKHGNSMLTPSGGESACRRLAGVADGDVLLTVRPEHAAINCHGDSNCVEALVTAVTFMGTHLRRMPRGEHAWRVSAPPEQPKTVAASLSETAPITRVADARRHTRVNWRQHSRIRKAITTSLSLRLRSASANGPSQRRVANDASPYLDSFYNGREIIRPPRQLACDADGTQHAKPTIFSPLRRLPQMAAKLPHTRRSNLPAFYIRRRAGPRVLLLRTTGLSYGGSLMLPAETAIEGQGLRWFTAPRSRALAPPCPCGTSLGAQAAQLHLQGGRDR